MEINNPELKFFSDFLFTQERKGDIKKEFGYFDGMNSFLGHIYRY